MKKQFRKGRLKNVGELSQRKWKALEFELTDEAQGIPQRPVSGRGHMLRSTKVFLLLLHLSLAARLIPVHIVCTFLLLSFTPQNSWSLRRTGAISVLKMQR